MIAFSANKKYRILTIWMVPIGKEVRRHNLRIPMRRILYPHDLDGPNGKGSAMPQLEDPNEKDTVKLRCAPSRMGPRSCIKSRFE